MLNLTLYRSRYCHGQEHVQHDHGEVQRKGGQLTQTNATNKPWMRKLIGEHRQGLLLNQRNKKLQVQKWQILSLGSYWTMMSSLLAWQILVPQMKPCPKP